MEFKVSSFGHQIQLLAFSENLTRCGLFNQNGDEITFIHYQRQVVSWEYDSGDECLVMEKVGGEDYSARFQVGAGTIKYIGFFNLSDDFIGWVDLEGEQKTYTESGIFDILDFEIDSIHQLI